MPERQRAADFLPISEVAYPSVMAFGLPKANMVPEENAANANFCPHQRKKLLIENSAHLS
jgi:hypothetical protein